MAWILSVQMNLIFPWLFFLCWCSKEMFGVVENVSCSLLHHLQISYANVHLIPKGCNLSFFILFSWVVSLIAAPLFLDQYYCIFHHSSQGLFSRLALLAFRCSKQLPSSMTTSLSILVLSYLGRMTSRAISKAQRLLDSPSRNLGQHRHTGYHVKSPLMSVRMVCSASHAPNLPRNKSQSRLSGDTGKLRIKNRQEKHSKCYCWTTFTYTVQAGRFLQAQMP